MNTIEKEVTNTITIKKSKFITTLIPVTTETRANELLKEIKETYRDANHNCYAYIIGINAENKKSSDDKEPSKTAGEPILNVLTNNNLTNILAVVTRYFGGTLLGTGGLIRAYSNSAIEALNKANLAEIIYVNKIIISINYKEYNTLENEINKYKILSQRFKDSIDITIEIPINKFENFTNTFKNFTKDKGILIVLDSYYTTK